MSLDLDTGASGALSSPGVEARETCANPGVEAREMCTNPRFDLAAMIPEGRYPLRAWTLIRSYLFAETIEDVSSRLRVYDLEGNFIKQIELPGIGSIDILGA